MQETVLETKRLCFRKMQRSDYGSLCTMLQDKEVMYAWEHAFDEREVREWLDRQLERMKNTEQRHLQQNTGIFKGSVI